MSDKVSSIRSLIMVFATIIFASTLFDALYGFKNLIKPGISLIYNAVGPQLTPNMVTLVVFDWRAFDTLGESLILVTAVLVVLLVFGKGKILDKNINADVLKSGAGLDDDFVESAVAFDDDFVESGVVSDANLVESGVDLDDLAEMDSKINDDGDDV